MISEAHADDTLQLLLWSKFLLRRGVSIVGEKQPVPSNSEELEQFFGRGGFIPTGGAAYRWRFSYMYGGQLRYGWRYPIRYWNRFGRSLFGLNCRFGRPWGGYFYC
ncbi:hypothetical protein CCR75_006268 [Bremia lactucae]|uniref:Uncharacterized protein n=1 Tax=Bremia lactucae TaxID=4779 RepID=A0A976FF09_BRELC|nr:hypothetical protein CCR75_006268 [Bremia lactucae]